MLLRTLTTLRNVITSKKHYSTFNVREKYRGPLKTAILDWSGTTADKYVIAPAIVFYNVFKKHNVPITMEEARLPMGLRKDLHIAKILEIPEVRERWTELRGSEPTQDDVDMLFEDFVPMQIECLPEYSGLLPETLSTVDMLKNHYNLNIGLTTGFTRDFSCYGKQSFVVILKLLIK